MHRTESTNATDTARYTNGPPATTVDSQEMNALQEELCYVIETLGITLNSRDTETYQQLYIALTSLAFLVALGINASPTEINTACDGITATSTEINSVAKDCKFNSNCLIQGAIGTTNTLRSGILRIEEGSGVGTVACTLFNMFNMTGISKEDNLDSLNPTTSFTIDGSGAMIGVKISELDDTPLAIISASLIMNSDAVLTPNIIHLNMDANYIYFSVFSDVTGVDLTALSASDIQILFSYIGN